MNSNDRLARYAPWIVLAGDLAALTLFVFQGQREHDLVNPRHPVLGLLLTAGEFALPYLAAVAWLRAFPRPEAVGLRGLLAGALSAWLIAAPLGVLLRAVALQRAVIPAIFLAVTLAAGAAYLLAWRLIFWLAWRRASRREQS